MSVSSESTYCITPPDNCQNVHSKQGSKGPKRIITTAKDIICKFSLTIKVDHLGFYVHLKNHCGHPIHTGHPQPCESDTILFQVNCLERKKLKTLLVLSILFVLIQWVVISWKENSTISLIQCAVIASSVNIIAKESAQRMTFLPCYLISNKEIKITTLSNIPIIVYLSTNEDSNFHNNKSNESIAISTSKNESVLSPIIQY